MDIENLKSFLKEKSNRKIWIDRNDFNPYDMLGSNLDKFITACNEDGETIMATLILTKFFKRES